MEVRETARPRGVQGGSAPRSRSPLLWGDRRGPPPAGARDRASGPVGGSLSGARAVLRRRGTWVVAAVCRDRPRAVKPGTCRRTPVIVASDATRA